MLNSTDALIMARSEIQAMADAADRGIEGLRKAGRYDDSPMAPYMLAQKITAQDALSAIDTAMAHVVEANWKEAAQ